MSVTLELSDDLIREVFARACELELLPEPAPAEPEWLTASEAAEHLRVSVASIHNAVSSGRLPRRYPKGHRARFRRSDLDGYVEGRAS